MNAIIPSTRLFAFLISLALISLSLACSRDAIPEPAPEPQSSTRKLQKITAGERNVESYTYDQQGRLASLHSVWRYADSTQASATLDAVITYDTQQRISQILYNGSLTVKFFYEGKLFDRTEEYDHKNRLVITHFYLFNTDNQLVELLDQYYDTTGGGTELYVKHRYEYDGQKNVQRVITLRRRVGDTTFTPWQTTTYEQYDQQKNPNNTLAHYPFVEQVCTQVNNPGKIITRNDTDQSINSVETLTYAYDPQGYPIRKTSQRTTSQSLPATDMFYQYE